MARPVDDSDSDGGGGRGRAGGFAWEGDPNRRRDAVEDAARQRPAARVDETQEDESRLRSGGISLSSEHRRPHDDTILQDLPAHTDPDMMRARQNSKGRKTRTFTVVGNGNSEENQIFAKSLNIAESPANVDIDRSNSKGENENLLDDIMNEPDDSSSQEDKGKADEEAAGDGAKDQKKGTQKSKGDS